MTVREILKMGDARLLRVARPVTAFDTLELHELVTDLFETMQVSNGAGLAAPQIGVDLAMVVFGFMHTPRYPDAEAVPPTVLINPQITPLGDAEEDGWEGCLSVPGLRGMVPRFSRIRYEGFDARGQRIERRLLHHDRGQNLGDILALKRLPPRKHLVQHHAERP
jgi:peptide deformylase